MNIYFVRHGESTENKYALFDPIDSPLTDLGTEQVKKVAKRFKNIKLDKIFCSDTVRARQTADEINKFQNVEIEESKLLREQLPPSEVWGKKEDDSDAIRIMNLIRKNIHDKNFRYSDEETFEDLKIRVFEFLINLEKLNFENVLVVGHGFVLRSLVGYILFKEKYDSYHFVSLRDNFKTTNTGVTICEFTKDHGLRLICWNDYSHLES